VAVAAEVATSRPTPAEAARYALRLGCLSFGGPAAQLALLYREVVEQRRWISDEDYSLALKLAMVLPGPEALQCVIFSGWRLYGIWGGLVAGLAFLLPAALMLVVLSWVYVVFGALPSVATAVLGLKSVVVALLALAFVAFARRMLIEAAAILIAAVVGAALLAHLVPVPVAIGFGALCGLCRSRAATAAPPVPPEPRAWWRSARVLATGLVLWAVPWVALQVTTVVPVARAVYEALTFVALGGFGGAYAMVAWVGDVFVHARGWLSPADLYAGLALSEATPGPLVIVLEFYGYLIGWHAPGQISPAMAALLLAALGVWATFLPSFVLVLGFAPHAARFAQQPLIGRALWGVGAAVVGILAAFASNVAMAVLVPHGVASLDLRACLITLVAAILLATRRVGLSWVLLGGMLAAWALY
jgi:chromate transporter